MMMREGPPRLPPKDLVALPRFAIVLDEQFPIPGLRARIGLDARLGFVPVTGDAGGPVLSSGIIPGARRHRVPAVPIPRVVLNVPLDTVGTVPVPGDILDILSFKENVDNVALLVGYRDPPRLPRKVAGNWRAAAGIAVLLIALFLGTLRAGGRPFSWMFGP
jgi:hypothetical protein